MTEALKQSHFRYLTQKDISDIYLLLPSSTIAFKGELIQSCAEVANKLSDFVEEKGAFKTICVDHKSGHFPGVFVDTLLSVIQGAPVPHSDFALTRANRDQGVAHLEKAFVQHFDEKRFVPPVLVVTDAVISGQALHPLVLYLKEKEIPFYICSMSSVLTPATLSFEDRDQFIDSDLAPSVALSILHGSANRLLYSKSGSAYARPSSGGPNHESKKMYDVMVLMGTEMGKRIVRK